SSAATLSCSLRAHAGSVPASSRPVLPSPRTRRSGGTPRAAPRSSARTARWPAATEASRSCPDLARLQGVAVFLDPTDDVGDGDGRGLAAGYQPDVTSR